jgi:hypothetical protein
MEHDFDILAARVLSGEATPEQLKRLEQMMEQNDELRSEFDELRATWATLKNAAPLVSAFDEAPTDPPPERLREWQQALIQKAPLDDEAREAASSARKPTGLALATIFKQLFSSPFRVGLAAICILGAIVAVILLARSPGEHDSTPMAYLVLREGAAQVLRDRKSIAVTSGMPLRGKDELRLSAGSSIALIKADGALLLNGPQTVRMAGLSGSNRAGTNVLAGNTASVRMALFQPPQQMAALRVTRRAGQGIRIYSPFGFTGNLTPPILWSSQPGKTYELSLRDEFAPQARPLYLAGVVPPLDFSTAWPGRTLAKDGLYRLIIAETDQPLTATELTFRTLREPDPPRPNTPTILLTAAYDLLSADPPRLGDALALLINLPPPLANSELSLRLKLFAFGQLGYDEEFNAALGRLTPQR